MPPLDKSLSQPNVDIDLILNFDGSVSSDSKIVSSPTPELGQRAIKALIQCQPYLLPAEKYAAWRVLPIAVNFALP